MGPPPDSGAGTRETLVGHATPAILSYPYVPENPGPPNLSKPQLSHADPGGSVTSPGHPARGEWLWEIDPAALHPLRPQGRASGWLHLSLGARAGAGRKELSVRR